MPGQQFAFTVTVTAPISDGSFPRWKLMMYGMIWSITTPVFGNNNVYVQVTVMPNYSAEAIGTVEIVQSNVEHSFTMLTAMPCPLGYVRMEH